MVVKIIGSHGGVSPGFRATSFLIDGKILIDAGSVTLGISIEEQSFIDHILISHAHLDHIGHLAYLCDNCFGLKSRPFEVYGNSPVIKSIKDHLFNDIIWPDFSKLPSKDKPTIKFNSITPDSPFHIDEYTIHPIAVNHNGGACGFIIEKEDCALVFTLDTGPTEKIWSKAKEIKHLKAIFTEVSFPNRLEQIAIDSYHHTPSTLHKELDKMPEDVPIFIGHLKPNFLEELNDEINSLDNDRLHIMGSDNAVITF